MTAKAKPVTIRGVQYPSCRAAAEALNVSEGTVRKSRSRGALETVGIGSGAHQRTAEKREQARLRMLSLKRTQDKHPRCKSVTIDGVTYPSKSAAAHALGLSRGQFDRYLANIARWEQ